MVTVIGLGFVGLTTALGFAQYGHKVYGIEANPERMKIIKGGKLPFFEPGLDEALTRHLGKNFFPTENLEDAVANSKYIFYCVGTPYGENEEVDLTDLYGALEQTLAVIHDDEFRVLVGRLMVSKTCRSAVCHMKTGTARCRPSMERQQSRSILLLTR